MSCGNYRSNARRVSPAIQAVETELGRLQAGFPQPRRVAVAPQAKYRKQPHAKYQAVAGTDALGQYLTRRANQRHSFIIAQSVKRPWARNGAPFGVMLGENPYPRLKLQWLTAARHPLQCHPKQCADKTYDPRRPGATSSLLSCHPNRSRSAPVNPDDKHAALEL